MNNSKRINQFYKTQLCPWHKEGKCFMQRDCNFAHSSEELRCKPNLIKTRMCSKFQKGYCDDLDCQFSHNIHELRATEGFFKSKICQYWQMGNCMRGKNCRFAHGSEEIKSNYDETQSLISTKDMNSNSSMDYESSFTSYAQSEHKLHQPAKTYNFIEENFSSPRAILVPSYHFDCFQIYHQNQPEFYTMFPQTCNFISHSPRY